MQEHDQQLADKLIELGNILLGHSPGTWAADLKKWIVEIQALKDASRDRQ